MSTKIPAEEKSSPFATDETPQLGYGGGYGEPSKLVDGDMVYWYPKSPSPSLAEDLKDVWRIIGIDESDAIIESEKGAVETADLSELILADAYGGSGDDDEGDDEGDDNVVYEREPTPPQEPQLNKGEEEKELVIPDMTIDSPFTGEVASSKQEEEEGVVSDDEDALNKLESGIQRDTLIDYHPEIRQSNYDEILTLSSVTRNKKGIIIDPLHKTVPFLTKYERARILGLRAKQLAHGADPLIEVPEQMIRGETIAVEELRQGRLPYIIRRPLPHGGNEYWKVADLEMLQF
jgi:DNA-directed RNA polymerase I, II, and III subunit RPABC2